MKPKYGKQPTPSLAPKFDDLIAILQSAETFHSSGPNQENKDDEKETELRGTARTFPLMPLPPDIIARQKAKKAAKAKTFPLMPLPPDIIARQKAKKAAKAQQLTEENKTNNDDQKDSVPSSTKKYVTDLKGKETETMKMIMNECKAKGLTSARLIRAPPQYYHESLEWRRNILAAPDVKYLCKSLLMKNIRCVNSDCSDPTNSLFYLVIFQYVTRINSEKMMKYVRELHEFKVGKKKFKFRLASTDENDTESGFEHNAVTPIAIRNSKIPIILSERLMELDHFWMGGGEEDVKLAVDTKEFIKVYKPYIADIVYDGWIDPDKEANNQEDRP